MQQHLPMLFLCRKERRVQLHFCYSILEENGVEKFIPNCLLQEKMLNCWVLKGKRKDES